jgi:hypothetical protein
MSPTVAAEYHRPGSFPPAVLTLPVQALADWEGKTDTLVTLESRRGGPVVARWDDGGVPQTATYDAGQRDRSPPFPDLPTQFVANAPGLLQALHEAMSTAQPQASRFATDQVLLRGAQGQIVGTDGRQLLLQSGFHFPWGEDLLVPRVPVFGGRELDQEASVEVGRTSSQVAVRAGPWTFWLTIDPSGRYPPAEAVVPSPASVTTRLHLDQTDAAFLANALPRLPGRDDELAPLTLDLGQSVVVRARAEGQAQATEVVLTRSSVTGPPVCLDLNRRYLHRALQLGFAVLEVVSADKPVCCRDGERVYVWMPLTTPAPLPAGPDPVRLASAEQATSPPPSAPERNQSSMPTPLSNGPTKDAIHPPGPQPERWGLAEVIAETEALRTALQEATTRTTRLLAVLKHQRRQSRAVQAAMTSLRELHLAP